MPVVTSPLPTYTPDVVNVDAIAATIRTQESGNNYTAHNGSATGAYQFLNSTWQGLTSRYTIGQQYSSAADAPPEIQDAVAKRYISDILNQNGNNVLAVPAIWYVGNIVTAQQMADSVPAPEAGNKLTVRQYVNKWFDTFKSISGQSPGSGINPGTIAGGIGAGLGAAGSTIWDTLSSPLEVAKAALQLAIKAGQFIVNPDTWKHILQVFGGAALVMMGLWILGSSFGMVPKASTVAKAAVKGAML